MSREAIEEAIEVLEDASADMLIETGDKNYYVEAIAVLRQALVDPEQKSDPSAWHGWVLREVLFDNGEPIGHREPEQEPVAWRSTSPDGKLSNKFACKPTEGNWVEPLYTAPQKKEWVGLTKEDMPDGDNPMFDTDEFYAGMVWAEAKLKEKNT